MCLVDDRRRFGCAKEAKQRTLSKRDKLKAGFAKGGDDVPKKC